MKHDIINMEKMKGTFDFYIVKDPEDRSGFMRYHNILTLDEFRQKWFEDSKPFTDKDYQALLMLRENDVLLTEDALRVVNKLIGDTKIRKKLRTIYDGSYYNNRVWLRYEYMKFTADIENDVLPTRDYFNKLDPVEKINWLYNHFDFIFIDIPSTTQIFELIPYPDTYSARVNVTSDMINNDYKRIITNIGIG